MTGLRITLKHCREAGFCAAGIRDFCRSTGLDMKRLALEGIPIEEAEGYDDARVQQLVARVKGVKHG